MTTLAPPRSPMTTRSHPVNAWLDVDSAVMTYDGSAPLPRHAATVAEIAVDGVRPDGGTGLLSYGIPSEWQDSLTAGQLVWVPLRKQLVLGVVVTVHAEAPDFPLKPLQTPVEPPMRVADHQLALGEWLAGETASSRFAALSPFLPPGVTHRVVHFLELADPARDPATLTPAQRKLVKLIQDRGEITLESARSALKSSLATVVPALEASGVIRLIPRVSQQAPHPKVERFLRLARDAATIDVAPRAERQREVIEFLTMQARLTPTDGDGLVSLADTLMRTKADHDVIATLAKKGIVEEVFLPRVREPLEGPPPDPVPPLTPAQAAAWGTIEARLTERDPTPLLLHGVTGSGKTEVYLRAVAWCLRHGRSAIVLVPEIALATQVVRRFIARFPGQVAILHSALTGAERHAAWQAIAAGRYRVVVGPRSALFAPVRDLGVVILDEEHDSAYKQDAGAALPRPLLRRAPGAGDRERSSSWAAPPRPWRPSGARRSPRSPGSSFPSESVPTCAGTVATTSSRWPCPRSRSSTSGWSCTGATLALQRAPARGAEPDRGRQGAGAPLPQPARARHRRPLPGLRRPPDLPLL